MKAKKWLSLFLALTLLLSAIGTVGFVTSAAIDTEQLDKLTVYGRTFTKNDTLYLYWTNSGFSFNMNGTGAKVTVETSNTNPTYYGYLNVYVDGSFEPTSTICIEKNGTYTLAENLPAGNHTIEVRKRNEANYGGSATIGVQSLEVIGGELLAEKPAAKAYQIEFIGDSITSGFGNMVTNGSGNYSTATEEGTMTYAVLAAKALGAEAQVLSRSGIRFVYSANGLDKVDSWYQHYENTATLPNDNRCTDKWDFAAHKSDVVVINLGTNDNGAKVNGATISDAEITKDAVEMLKLVRKNNPDALIIWTYGLMGNGRRAALEAAVQQFGDANTFYLPLANVQQKTEGLGIGSHPSIQADINRSMDLAKFIAEKKGWTVDYSVPLKAQLQLSAPYGSDETMKEYTELSAVKFRKALEDAKTVANAADATAEQQLAAISSVQDTYNGLVALSDMSADYTIIDTFDTQGNWVGVKSVSVDSENQKRGTGCITTSGDSSLVNFQNTALSITLPEDWENWYVEGWLYVNDPTALPNESVLELSQEVDKIEMAWNLNSLGLKAGWNKIQLRMGSGNASKKEEFKVLANIRLYNVNVSKQLVLKMDDFVLAKGKAAADINEWSKQVAAAEEALKSTEYPADQLAKVQAALTAAEEAVTQRDVDVTTADLKAAIEALTKTPIEEPDTKPWEKLTTYGRTYVKNDTLFLYWTNSGFSFYTDGTGVKVTVNTSNTNPIYLGYLNVYVDGSFEPVNTVCITKNGTYTLVEDLPAGNHTIEVRKRNEANYGGSATIGVQSLEVIGGKVLEENPAAPIRQIEFIGDSITSGFGNMISDASGNFTTETEEGTMTYAVLAAKALGADAQVLSRSGIRFVYSNPGLDKVDSWYQHYENTATLPSDNRCDDKWDFAAHKSDVVVINLGTNDNGAKVDGQTISDAELTKDAVEMLKLVRKNNPDALIIWTYGIMGNGRQAALEEAVKQFGDANAYYLPLDNINQTTEGMATHGHPTIQTDINRSMDLAEFIAEKKGWAVDYSVSLKAQLQISDDYDNDEALTGYTDLSVAAFRKALADGKALIADEEATDDQLIAAIEKIQKTYNNLVSVADMDATYTVISDCDEKGSWGSAKTLTVDTENQKQGAGCLMVSSDSEFANFQNTALNVTLPEDWQDWYLEFWLYVDDPTAIPGGSCIELSQTVDQIEVQWGLDSLGLHAGWNKIQLRMGNGSLTKPEEFQTLNNIRLFVVNMTKPIVMRLDDIVLAKGKAAADIDEWSKQVAEAEQVLEAAEYPADQLAKLQAALTAAEDAKTQRDVDVAAETLKTIMESLTKAPAVTYGDVNNDGNIDSSDARIVLQAAVNKVTLTEEQILAADVDGNETIDSSDARAILQKAVNKIDQFDVEKNAEA